MKTRIESFILIAIVVLLLMVVPAVAQDVTEPVPTEEPTVFVTVAPEPTVVVEPTPEPAPPVLTPENAISISTLIYGIIIAVLGGGMVGAVILRFGTNKNNLDALEKLYQGASPETQQLIRERFVELEDTIKHLLNIIDKATDNKPNDAAS